MLVLYKKNQLLYVKVKLELRLPIKYENKKFRVGLHEELLLSEEVMHILTVNGNIRLWNGNKFVKLNLGQFYDIMKNKNYKVENYVEPVKPQEPKKVEPIVQPEVKQEQPKVKEKVVEEPKKVEPIVQPEVKQEQPKAEEKQENNNNKKQRHNNNNKQNNQGGDK